MDEALSSDDDDYYTSLLLMQYSQNIENNNQTLLSDDDEKFAQELQLQETLIYSLTTSKTSHTIEVGESSSSPSKKRHRSNEVGESSSSEKRKRSLKEVGEPSSSSFSSSLPSSSSRFVCEICMKRKLKHKIFPFLHHECSHKFCISCVTRYVTTKLKHGKSPSITCPGPDCEGILGIEECTEGFLPKEVATLWDEVICESVIIPSSQRVYCPYKNCSALLMNDDDVGNMRQAECPSCRRLFCVKCNVPWHSEFDCEQFSRMRESESGGEDLMLHALAKKKNWRRCNQCNFYVERKNGCRHMTCRCGFEFCYKCGGRWSTFSHDCCRRPR